MLDFKKLKDNVPTTIKMPTLHVFIMVYLPAGNALTITIIV